MDVSCERGVPGSGAGKCTKVFLDGEDNDEGRDCV